MIFPICYYKVFKNSWLCRKHFYHSKKKFFFLCVCVCVCIYIYIYIYYILSVSGKQKSFCNLITWSILVQISPNFYSMCENKSKFCGFFSFSSIDMPFTRKEKVFSLLEYAQSQTRLCSKHLCENLLKIQQLQCRFEHSHRVKRKSVCAGKKKGAGLLTWHVPCHRWYTYWKLVKSLNFSFKF